MGLIDALMLAAALSMDSFAVAAGVGLAAAKVTGSVAFRISFHFALFQAILLASGWYLGRWVGPLIGGYDHWLAMALLWLVGLRMIHEWRGELKQTTKPDSQARDLSRGIWLVILSLSTSIDAMAAGVSLGLLTPKIWNPVMVIAIVTVCMALAGLLAGQRLGKTLGTKAMLAGGVILCGLGIKVVLDHTVWAAAIN